MAEHISALELTPAQLIREVSPDAVEFYVNGLSGIYLPQDVLDEHAGSFDVKYWKPDDRLRGKFGRFVVRQSNEDDPNTRKKIDDILLMGTTIGVGDLDLREKFACLRHYEFSGPLQTLLLEREYARNEVIVSSVDYGDVGILLAQNGQTESIRVGGSSIDFGRATTGGRQKTCELFQGLLGDSIKVINADPEPRQYQKIIKLN